MKGSAAKHQVHVRRINVPNGVEQIQPFSSTDACFRSCPSNLKRERIEK